MKCYMCGVELTESNKSKEHIIPNAIGGRLKAYWILCAPCNNQLGEIIDVEIVNQLEGLITIFDVKKERGYPAKIEGVTANNQSVLLSSDGSVDFKKPIRNETGDKSKFSFTVSNEKMMESVLTGIKKRHTVKNIEISRGKFNNQPITYNFKFGSKEVLQGYVKIAVNFYMYNNGEFSYVNEAVKFIKGEIDNYDVYYLYSKNEIVPKIKLKLIHSIILCGDSNKRLLYVYIELFNEFNVIVFLSRDYEGENYYKSFHYDLLSNEEIEFEIPIRLSNRNIKKDIYENIPYGLFSRRLEYMSQLIKDFNIDRKINKITNRAMEETLVKYPSTEYEYFTKEMISYFSNKVAELYVEDLKNYK